MKAFRIGSGIHAIFDGTGASVYPGRWNEANQRVIYAGASFATAMLERLCYLALGRLPTGDRFVEIEIPDDLVETFDAERLPGWDASGSEVARSFGADWWRARRSVALLVPSAVTKIDRNIVINETHPDFRRIAAGPERSVEWDRRLFVR